MAVPKAKHSKRAKVAHPDREGQFLKLWQAFASDKPLPERQYVFHATRKWRFDFAWPQFKVAVEIDGGVFQRKATGHRSMDGVVKQMEKLNIAQIAGWKVLRFHPNDLDKTPEDTVRMVESAFWIQPQVSE
ncbi:DUF559 domain-containing protein [Schlesneria sp.]|uniref:DUF559 domain-containing protein n=1 Tax=Schlesneria sp. TaxID=2762018 RepID=UPI002F0A6961